MQRLTPLLAIILTLVILMPACAVSLWGPYSGSLFADHKAHRVGDIVTVVIAESSSTEHSAETDTDKKMDVQNSTGTGIFDFIRSFSLSSERSSEGSGSAVQTTTLVDRISAKVVEVLPNGLLRIHGERTVNLHKEELKLTLTGLVRTQDIGPDNSVLSTQVAELNISSVGEGRISDSQKPGLIYRLIRLLW
ncbi:MAG: flagellar basal body L-ring protein FlgH [Armatimonadetes bacterium]|nr:flagellar basal body L-ring protein FlgH [Armatimonadota bacterium]NIM24361.1 flagellar basal body L-ring protein FlgH [Armatimonadota bacterium]NIM68230.1 flagellar basal body L-ring protein FlgH [Armatimonadota bacterium]NIM75131.1 flagellar basal body L-ring protein FlgH [Armatimonadota bacterium]NIN06435.1 flagellar basal body L-ring protein FlgH [Armatimonadota bacterium]